MRWRLGCLGLLGGILAGCNPPEVAPMTPPGVAFPRVQDDGAEALGEKLSQGTVQPSDVAPAAGGSTQNPGRVPTEPNREGETPGT